MSINIKIEIIVTRVRSGLTTRATGLVEACGEVNAVNPAYLADRVARKALRLVEPEYMEVTKSSTETETVEVKPSAKPSP